MAGQYADMAGSLRLILQSGGDPAVGRLLDEFVAGVVAAPSKNDEFRRIYYGDDYEHSYDLATPGHLIQAAIAHRRAPEARRFSNAPCGWRMTFSRSSRTGNSRVMPASKWPWWNCTGRPATKSYLHGARHFLGPWLRQRPVIGGGSGLYKDNAWADTWCGRHVVRQPYLCAGGADYLAETGDAAFREQLNAIWSDMATGKMQLSGAPCHPQDGTSARSRSLTSRSTFPPASSSFVTESLNWDSNCARRLATCIGIGGCSWEPATRSMPISSSASSTMAFWPTFRSTGRRSITSALASDGDDPPRTAAAQPVTSCCSPNALRLIASMPGYVFNSSDNGLWVQQYADCRLDWRLADGTPVQVIQKTRYPWSGTIAVEVRLERPATFDLNLRIPGWCRDAVIRVNGIEADVPATGGAYCSLTRSCAKATFVTLDLAMPILAMAADPRVAAFKDKTALMRGPLVYCFEGVDNPGQDVSRICLADGSELQPLDNRMTPASLYQPCAEHRGLTRSGRRDC